MCMNEVGEFGYQENGGGERDAFIERHHQIYVKCAANATKVGRLHVKSLSTFKKWIILEFSILLGSYGHICQKIPNPVRSSKSSW